MPDHPLDEYLNRGITVNEARCLLDRSGCLEFPQFHSGMFPARRVNSLDHVHSGMANAWLRDTSAIGLVLIEDGQIGLAAKAAYGILNCLGKVADDFSRIIELGHAPADESTRPPISFIGQNSDPRRDWGNAQNDALGYVLQFISAAASTGVVELTDTHKLCLQLLPRYLKTIAYWQDADSGHWEEDRRVNASSIGTVVAGLEAAKDLFDDQATVDKLITNGRQALDTILPDESLVPVRRPYDAALLFLVEPMHVLADEMATQIIVNIEDHLVGDHGVRRYIGDSYWAPNYRGYYTEIERSGNFSEYADLAKRDKLLTPGNEAQWTLFDPLLSAYYARLYQSEPLSTFKDKAVLYLVRSLRAVVSQSVPNTDKHISRIPEAYFLENSRWIPNDNPGLLWAQANLIYAINVFKEVFGDTLLKF